MPKAFSEQEKEVIRRTFHEKGKALFEQYGLRKTTVDELAGQVGISKGAFYLFYDSKEELYMEILEGIESDLRTRLFEIVLADDDSARQSVKRLLESMLVSWEQYPLLKNLNQADFEYLTRKLPAERIQLHAQNDSQFADELLQKIEHEGIPVKANPRLVLNLMKSLFLLSLHRHELGDRDYNEMMDVLIDLVAGYIVEGVS